MLRLLALMAVVTAAIPIHAADADPEYNRAWRQKKCALYDGFQREAAARLNGGGLGTAFLEAQEAFIRSGCTERVKICPASPQELDFANIVSLQMMNAGATGSFLPFECRNG
ncbi:hypothetical protein [Nitratireductor thuwali]|uniref:DUF1311 domain-containing protein n=1 Tax=Nitratireductor thuwali TaxID=2267699 RepID=A0ABY5MH41_9HYPH|nr:hypothetical protein NTH_00791 [Nitratireductor thuwali]